MNTEKAHRLFFTWLCTLGRWEQLHNAQWSKKIRVDKGQEEEKIWNRKTTIIITDRWNISHIICDFPFVFYLEHLLVSFLFSSIHTITIFTPGVFRRLLFCSRDNIPVNGSENHLLNFPDDWECCPYLLVSTNCTSSMKVLRTYLAFSNIFFIIISFTYRYSTLQTVSMANTVSVVCLVVCWYSHGRGSTCLVRPWENQIRMVNYCKIKMENPRLHWVVIIVDRRGKTIVNLNMRFVTAILGSFVALLFYGKEWIERDKVNSKQLVIIDWISNGWERVGQARYWRKQCEKPVFSVEKRADIK